MKFHSTTHQSSWKRHENLRKISYLFASRVCAVFRISSLSQLASPRRRLPISLCGKGDVISSVSLSNSQRPSRVPRFTTKSCWDDLYFGFSCQMESCRSFWHMKEEETIKFWEKCSRFFLWKMLEAGFVLARHERCQHAAVPLAAISPT
jgi:hypothetical protein